MNFAGIGLKGTPKNGWDASPRPSLEHIYDSAVEPHSPKSPRSPGAARLSRGLSGIKDGKAFKLASGPATGITVPRVRTSEMLNEIENGNGEPTPPPPPPEAPPPRLGIDQDQDIKVLSSPSLASKGSLSNASAASQEDSGHTRHAKAASYRDQQKEHIEAELQKMQTKEEQKKELDRKGSMWSRAGSNRMLHLLEENKDHWILSNQANVVFGGVILLNAVYVGIELELRSPSSDTDIEPGWFTVESLFLFTFLVELLLRVRALRDQVMRDWWNCFDTALVVLGIIDTWIFAILRSALGKDPAKEVMSFQVFRLVRLLRVLRVIRIVRFFRELLFLVKGILISMKALFPSLVLIVLLLYMSAVFIFRVLGRKADPGLDPDEEEDMDKWFGTVGRSLFTLFQLMTLDGWPTVVRTLMRNYHPAIMLFFLAFLIISHYTLLNLVTAVVVENVLVISQQEQMKEVKREEQARFENIRKLKELFENIDEDGNGEVSVEEFSEAMKDKEIVKQFNQLEIASYEAMDLFELLDIDHDGSVTVSEFVEGCLRVRGHAKSKHLLAVQYDLQRFWTDMITLSEDIQGIMDKEDDYESPSPDSPLTPLSPLSPNVQEDKSKSINDFLNPTSDLVPEGHAASASSHRPYIEVVKHDPLQADNNAFDLTSTIESVEIPSVVPAPSDVPSTSRPEKTEIRGRLAFSPEKPRLKPRHDPARYDSNRSQADAGDGVEPFSIGKRSSLDSTCSAASAKFGKLRSDRSSLSQRPDNEGNVGRRRSKEKRPSLPRARRGSFSKVKDACEIHDTVKQGFKQLEDAVQNLAGGQREINEMLKSKLERMQRSLADL